MKKGTKPTLDPKLASLELALVRNGLDGYWDALAAEPVSVPTRKTTVVRRDHADDEEADDERPGVDQEIMMF